MSAKPKARAEPILSARGIVNRFGKQVVHDKLDLDIEEGEVLGIAGGSGSGKSVLLKTLTGLHRPDAGTVVLAGKPVDELSNADKASLIGVLFQQGALFSSLTVAQNIMLPMREYTKLEPDERERIAAMKLELAGMTAESGLKLPNELSGGMVKRAALARALALDPRILFLDEPTSDLDPLNASGIDELVTKLNESLGVTVVIVTHDLTTLFTVCPASRSGGQDSHHRHDRQAVRSRQPDPSFLHGRGEGAMGARRKEWKRISISSRALLIGSLASTHVRMDRRPATQRALSNSLRRVRTDGPRRPGEIQRRRRGHGEGGDRRIEPGELGREPAGTPSDRIPARASS